MKLTNKHNFCLGVLLLFLCAQTMMAQVASVEIEGDESMFFGPSPDEAANNEYTLKVYDSDKSPISESQLAADGFTVTWDIEGFKTANDTEGQYCDSYGSFTTNGAASLTTNFALRNVPMNFYGRMTATLSTGGKTYKAVKYVVALGNKKKSIGQVLPLAGYPTEYNDYPAELVGYQSIKNTYGDGSDIILGGWNVAGSDGSCKAVLSKDADGTKYVRFTSATAKKSHIYTKKLDTPMGELTFKSRIRFSVSGTVMTFTAGYPMWQSKKYACPITLNYDGTKLTLNGTALKKDGANAAIAKNKWYNIVLYTDKSTEKCAAHVYDGETLVASTDTIDWAEKGVAPVYFSIGMDNNGVGNVDIASCEASKGQAGGGDVDVTSEMNLTVEKGNFYSVEVTYQGILSTGYINGDLSGYTLGTHATMATETYIIPATRNIIDLHVADADATHVGNITKATATVQPKRQKRSKRVVHHIGDSTSANNGSWAHRLKSIIQSKYPELVELCDFHNDGAGGRNLSTYYSDGKLASVLKDIYPGDVLILGNMGTNGMGSNFEADVNYYLNAAEMLGAQVMLNSYTPHGAVSSWTSGYNSTTNTFDSYRKDSYETVVRSVASQREKNDADYLGFVEIGKNADAAFNAYVADYAKNGYSSADAAAQAIIKCFTDHNHYSNGTLACDLMLNGYGDVKGIVAQMVEILSEKPEPDPTPDPEPDPTPDPEPDPEVGIQNVGMQSSATTTEETYNIYGQRLSADSALAQQPGTVYIKGGRKVMATK